MSYSHPSISLSLSLSLLRFVGTFCARVLVAPGREIGTSVRAQ